MIQREWQIVKRRVFVDGIDDYGQLRKKGYTDTEIPMVVKIYHQSNVDNPKFIDVDKIGLTEEEVNIGDKIIIDGKDYDVKYLIPSGRYLQVFLINNG